MTHLWDIFTDTCKRCGLEREVKANPNAPGLRYPSGFLYKYRLPGKAWTDEMPACTGGSIQKQYQPTGRPPGRPKKQST